MSERLRAVTTAEGLTLAIHHGDLTAEEVDAIVNAANGHLAHGGGVALAIVRRGGASIQAESDAWVRLHGAVPTGRVALTGGGSLPCRAVIHAVGPVWHGGSRDEPALLRSAVRESLELAHREGYASVALPAVSSGIFGFPKPLCAEILVDEAVSFGQRRPGSTVREVRFTNFDTPTVAVFEAEFARRFGEE
jgi:O-acetyl-ADP-ribose deacetylase (regulator of RNase III)